VARLLFRVAAGPRTGFGHLVRAARLAAAAGVPAAVSVRGPRTAIAVAPRLGLIAADAWPSRLAADGWRVLVVDDPHADHAARWIRAAEAQGLRVVSVHDLGIGTPSRDIVVDGSIVSPLGTAAAPGRRGARRAAVATAVRYLGPRYAVVGQPGPVARASEGTGPASKAEGSGTAREARGRRPPPDGRGARILVALGGGARAAAARRIAVEVARRLPAAHVSVAPGFAASPTGGHAHPATSSGAGAASARRPGARRATASSAHVREIPPGDFARELSAAHVAVLAGGVSLYEACAAGTATIAVTVVDPQRPTVRAFAARRLAVDGGDVRARALGEHARRIAGLVVTLWADARRRQALAARGPRAIDGRGAERIGAVLGQLTGVASDEPAGAPARRRAAAAGPSAAGRASQASRRTIPDRARS
jgi:hypothetical protein